MPFSFPLIDLYAGHIADPVGDLFVALNAPGVISFAGGVPDAGLFRTDDLRASFDWVLTHDGRRALQYGTSEGDPGLREEAAARVGRWVPTASGQIQITSGSQEAIYLTALVMLNRGDTILVEEPTYLAAVQAFSLVGARMVGVETDDDGIVPDALAAAIATHAPRALYLVPNFSNPTGRTMTAERRAAVAEVLLASDVALVNQISHYIVNAGGKRLRPSLVLLSSGALGYRVVQLLARNAAFRPSMDADQNEVLERTARLLDWAPAHLVALTLALVSDFDAVVKTWRDYHAAHGKGYFTLDLGFLGELARAGVDADVEAGDGYAHDVADPMAELTDAHKVLRRVLVAWLALIALAAVLVIGH